ncbi:MAG TPA: O-antigen ligase family protein, partial [Saprospiraceae bacterium]|nr:O-antigen ligase family protein [Saprospiraceae bacterium]
MLRRLFAIPDRHPQGRLLAAFAGLCVLTISASIVLEAWWLMALPAAMLTVWVAALDFRPVFFLMLAAIPLSMEAELPGGLGTDLVSEPLMWLLTLASGLWLLRHGANIDGRFVRHPISLLLLLHLAWTVVCSAGSQDWVVSLKFLLAKVWYVAVFYFLASRMLQTERDFKSFVWCFFVPLFFIVPVVLWRHAALGFSFKDVERVMGPFFRNHVMYACMLAVFLPFVWYATYWYRRGAAVWWWLVAGILLFLTGINFAYTRAAYVALVAAVGIYWLMRRRLMKVTLAAALLVGALFVGFVRSGDNWLEFAPDFERTVTHARFDNLLEATTKLQDISTMERVHRWVAASYMIRDRPLLGFGPGTFYFFYQHYTVTSFKTYVSRNPERSGIHNYY